MTSIGNKEVFARNLSYYLDRSGRSQREVADVAGVSPSTFSEWTKGKKYPRIDKIEILANYFGVLKSDLIEDKDENERSPGQLQLTEGEQMMIDIFRLIPEEQQRVFLEMGRAYANSLKKD